MPVTKYGKSAIARATFSRGASFLAASILLEEHGAAHQYVVLHLRCQGAELILKAALLLRDFDKYRNKLATQFGHNLVKLAEASTQEFGLKPMSPKLLGELKALNKFYSEHMLRYGGLHDILIDPSTISADLTHRRIAAVVRLVSRHLKSLGQLVKT